MWNQLEVSMRLNIFSFSLLVLSMQPKHTPHYQSSENLFTLTGHRSIDWLGGFNNFSDLPSMFFSSYIYLFQNWQKIKVPIEIVAIINNHSQFWKLCSGNRKKMRKKYGGFLQQLPVISTADMVVITNISHCDMRHFEMVTSLNQDNIQYKPDVTF